MKLVKAQVLLYMFERLMVNKLLDVKEIKTTFAISDKTFARYISEIRTYYSNFFRQDELVYNRKDKKYYLINR